MTMSPPVRRLVLTGHIATSVGWLGAVLTYLALDVAAVTSQDASTVRAVYIAMGLTVSFVIVPLALTSILVGIINALGTSWGLLRHYWVLAKFFLTLAATAVLLVEAPSVREMASAAASDSDPRSLPGSLPHSVGGLTVLVLVTILSVYKPRGVTRYGWRRQQEERISRQSAAATGP